MKSLLAALTTTTAIVALAAPAHAAEARDYAIEAGSLEAALDAFGRQSGEQVLYRVDDVQGKSSSGVTGRQSPEQALRKILAGTGLRVVKGAGGALAIAGNGQGGDQAATEAPSGQGLRGAIVDETTGAALKGAFVDLVGTGQSTVSDDLGRYRFAGLKGTHRVRISYLGFPAVERDVEFAGGAPLTAIVLANDPAANEILVVGYTSARAQALNQERTAENTSTVISADLLGNFQGTTISDALRRAPGVAFEQDRQTGDGTKIIVRGLSPDYNQVNLNGQSLLVAGGAGRSADLNGILADSVSEVRISKTLLANQDSSGTGGLVEIETKSPLDRADNFVSVGAEYKKRAGNFGDELLLTGTISQKFGSAKNFGVSASIQHRRQTGTSYYYNASGNVGPYLPVGADGVPLAIEDIDPRRRYPFEEGVDDYYIYGSSAFFNQNKSSTTALTVSAAWDWSDHTSLRLDYIRSYRNYEYQEAGTYISAPSGYELLPVAALNGAPRYVLRADPANFSTSLSASAAKSSDRLDTVSLRGTSHFGPLSLTYQAGYNAVKGGTPKGYNVGLEGIGGLMPSSVLPEAIDPRTGQIPGLFGTRNRAGYPLPLLTEEGYALADAATGANFSYGSVSLDNRSRSRSFNGEFQAKWEFGDTLRYIDAGVSYKSSLFRSFYGQTESYYAGVVPATGSDVGLGFIDAPFDRVAGSHRTLRFIDPTSIAIFTGNRDALIDAGQVTYFLEEPNPLLNKTKTKESELAAYIQSRVDIGKLELIGGVRMSRVTVDSTFANAIQFRNAQGVYDAAYYQESLVAVSQSATQTNLLPRVQANFRVNEQMVLRAGYFMSVARPQLQLLTDARFISLNLRPRGGPNRNQPTLSINSGNPALKPASTHNLDLSAEYYDKNVGALKLGLFYKKLNNLLESNSIAGLDNISGFELPDNPRFENLPANLFVTYTTPVNNPDPGHIWGIEASLEKRLTFLPGLLSGLGVYANYTYTKSRKTALRTWYSKPAIDSNGNPTRVQEDYLVKGAPFAGQPPHSGTVGLTFTNKGLDASVLYSYQARRFSGPGDFGLDLFDEATDTLDFRASYRFDLLGGDVRLYIEGNNLLKGAKDASVEQSLGGSGGVPRYYTGGNFIGGRAVTAGFTVSF
ncbi:TonB-dependent receptor [Sphingopyxis fribergensis]